MAAALYRVRGDPTRAAEYHRQALTLSREIASPRDEACALAGLGRCALAPGRTSGAAENLRQARDIFQRIGAAEAVGLGAELDSLARPGQASPKLEQTDCAAREASSTIASSATADKSTRNWTDNGAPGTAR